MENRREQYRSQFILKAALHYAEGNRWIERQPQFVMPVRQPPPRDIWLTRKQVGILIEKAKTPHLQLFIKIAVSTAARSGAILDLKWSQLDFEQRIIDFGRGYGNKRRAVVPMNDDVYESLCSARELALTDHVIEYNGKPVKSVKKGFRQLCLDNNIKASPHVLRHTAATWLAEIYRDNELGKLFFVIKGVHFKDGHHRPDDGKFHEHLAVLHEVDSLAPFREEMDMNELRLVTVYAHTKN